jgi:hypothetical protein
MIVSCTKGFLGKECTHGWRYLCVVRGLSWIQTWREIRLRFVTTSWRFSFIQRTYEVLFCMQYLRWNFSMHFYGTCLSIIWTHRAPHFTHTLGQVRAKFFMPKLWCSLAHNPFILPRALSNVQKPLMSRGRLRYFVSLDILCKVTLPKVTFVI